MPIDSSIYNRTPLANFADKGAEGMQNGMTMRSQMDQARRANDAEAMQRNSADALRNSMVTNADGSRSLDTKRAASNLFGVDPMKGLAFQKEAQNEEIEKQKATREKQKFEVDLTAQLAGSVKDQPSWDNALVTAQKYGIDTTQLPKQYDPNFVKMIHGRALSAKEQLDATYKVQDFQLREKELGSRAADRAEARNERRFQAGIKMDEKAQAMQTPYGLANSVDDAKQLKEAHESKKNFDSKLNEMIALREKNKGGALLNRDDVGRGQQLSKDLLLEYKNMAKLGVLSKSDEDIINAIIPADPLQYNSPLASIQGQDPTLHRLKSFKSDSDKDFSNRVQTRTRSGINQAANGPKQEADVASFAQAHGISYEAAAQVKAQRTSKQAGM